MNLEKKNEYKRKRGRGRKRKGVREREREREKYICIWMLKRIEENYWKGE